MTSPSTLDLPGLTFPALGSQATEMRLLSLWQPWATLVAVGAKQIETRSWQTPYRGKIAIHAAIKFPKEAMELCYQEPFYSALFDQEGFPRKELPTGCIVATCDLLDCIKVLPEQTGFHYGPNLGTNPEGGYRVWQVPPLQPERSFGNYEAGRYAWLLGNIQPLAEPLPWKGAQGLRAIQWPENNLVQHQAKPV